LGGKFEAEETPEECVIREIPEESGLSVHNPKLYGLLIFPEFKGNDWYVFVFTATEFTGELIDSPQGRLEWIADEKILDLPLWESDHIFMPWIQEGKFFSAKFEYEGIRCVDTMWFSIPTKCRMISKLEFILQIISKVW